MAYNDISKNYTYENGGTIDGDLALTTMAANTKIKNKASGELYTKRSGFSNVFDKSNTLADYLKADEFGINTSGSGNGVASITYSSSGRKITQNLTTFTTPSDLATANDNLKSQAVGSITVSGRTVTYKNVNGQTLGSFQTQDNNTTYSAGSGLSLSGTTFNVTSTAGNSNLQWNAEVTLGTVGGFAIKAKLPANPNTDTTYSAGTGLSLNGTQFNVNIPNYKVSDGTNPDATYIMTLDISQNACHPSQYTIGSLIDYINTKVANSCSDSQTYWFIEGDSISNPYSASDIYSSYSAYTTTYTGTGGCGGGGCSTHTYTRASGYHPADGTYNCTFVRTIQQTTQLDHNSWDVGIIQVTITKIA